MNTAWISGRELNFPDLKVANALLSNRAALEEALDRNGYLFFREVLDQDAFAKLRSAYVEELAKLGVVSLGDPFVRYNGQSLEDLPKTPVSGIIAGLLKRALHR